MIKRMTKLILWLSLCVCLSMPVLATNGVADPADVKNSGSPYYIAVNRATCTVTIYTLDEEGYYSVPLRAMICSVGKQESVTPLGAYRTSTYKPKWLRMLDDSYGQYVTQFRGDYLFHSICYESKYADALITNEYNELGSAASLGCVRLQVADAKWIYDNCPSNTIVSIYDDAQNPGPLGQPEKAIAYLDATDPDSNWDPTDPNPGNPWLGKVVTDISLPYESMELVVGQTYTLQPEVTPANLSAKFRYLSSEPSVATVDENGRIIARSAGSTRISVSTGSYFAHLNLTVTGEALPFDDLSVEEQYYNEIRAVYEHGIMSGSEGHFLPKSDLNRVMGIQILYNLSGEGKASDVVQDPWYQIPLIWAMENGLCQGMSTSKTFLEKSLTREDFVVLLYRFHVYANGHVSGTQENLTSFLDSNEIGSFAEEAISWAVENGVLLKENNNRLHPKDTITRAEAASILSRYLEL